MSYGYEDEPRPRRVANTPELRARKPSGNVAFPLLLVEGEEKAGKTFASLALSASPRVGRTFVFDLGEGTADEYASLGPYEVVDHDGTFSDLRGQIRAAMAVPSDPEKPNVIVLDSGSILWGLLKKWTDLRARNSRKGRAALQADPDAEIDPTMNLWNDAKERWKDIVDGLRTWPGIAIVIARGQEVSKVEGGQPVAGQTVWSVEAEKTLTFEATAWVRMHRSPRRAVLVGARSLFVDVPDGGLTLPVENTLEHLVFEVLGSGGRFGPSSLTLPQIGVPSAQAKVRLLAAVQAAHPSLTEQEAKDEAKRAWDSEFGQVAEVTEAALRKLLDAVAGRTPPEDPDQGPGATETAETAQEGQTTEPDPVVAQGESWDQFEARIRKLNKRDLVAHLQEAGLPTSGKVEAMQTRLLDAFRPFYEEGATGTFATGSQVVPETEEPTEEQTAEAVEKLQEALGAEPVEEEVLPPGWIEEKCVCGEPAWSEKGNFSATVRHKDRRLDAEHRADVAF